MEQYSCKRNRPEDFTYKRSNHFESLDSMRIYEELCDVTIKVDFFFSKDVNK